MSFHKIAPVKKNDCKKGAPAPRRRPVGHQG